MIHFSDSLQAASPSALDAVKYMERRLSCSENIRESIAEHAKADLAALRSRCETLEKALRAAKRKHSDELLCPASIKYLKHTPFHECICGADAHNTAIDAAIAAAQQKGE